MLQRRRKNTNVTSKRAKSDHRQDPNVEPNRTKICLCVSMKMFSIGEIVVLRYQGMHECGFDRITKLT